MKKDDDVTKKKGIIEYILSRDERHLSVRAFTQSQKEQMYEVQGGICPGCGEHFELCEMEADHKKPWSQGGKTEVANGQMLCSDCNRKKSDGLLHTINVNGNVTIGKANIGTFIETEKRV